MAYDPLVSIIIPVYKVEKYLDECVYSVINQTYKNLEIILVDDGSPDQCPEMCDAYKSVDSRIVVIHKENGGPGNARNAGAAVATGKYIEFLDSDDWLVPETVEICVRETEKNNLDILFFSACSFVEDGDVVDEKVMNTYTRTSNFNEVMDGVTCFIRTRDLGEYFAQICMRFYNATYWEHYCFQEKILHEDEDVAFLSLIQAERVEIIDRRFYQRRYHCGSIMTSKSNLRSAEGYACAFEGLAKVYLSCDERKRNLIIKQMLVYIGNVMRLYEWSEIKCIFQDKVQSHLLTGLRLGIPLPKSYKIAMRSLHYWHITQKMDYLVYKIGAPPLHCFRHLLHLLRGRD